MDARGYRVVAWISGALALAAAACGGRAPDVALDTPGAKAWSELSCKTDADCHKGEACGEGICQLKQCGSDKLISASPMGPTAYLALNRNLVAATRDATLEGYSSRDSTFARSGSSFDAKGPIVDVAGGHLLAVGADVLATASTGSTQLMLAQNGKKLPSAELGFVPIALATGDSDGDGIDELVAAASDGTFAVCRVTEKATACTRQQGPGGIVDMAMGDVDGDGFAEPVFLVGDTIYVYNLDAEKTKQQTVMRFAAGRTMIRIAAGDVDGNGIADIVGVESGGSWPWSEDKVAVFAWYEGALAFQHELVVPKSSRDVLVEHLGSSRGVGDSDIALLGADNAIQVLSWTKKDGLVSRFRSTLNGETDMMRLAGADMNGSSARAKLKGTPKIVAGPTVPLSVLTFPPYSSTYSRGPSNVSLGTSVNTSETKGESVTLNVGYSISATFELPIVSKASISRHIDWASTTSKAFNTTISIGETFGLTAEPEADGWDSGAVVIAAACYQQFEYEVSDPAHVMGADADGNTITVNVPVGGQSSAWSIRRYNALAEALGTLPKIKLPYRLGELESYPTEPRRLDGTPIPPQDLLFKETNTLRVSDSTRADFSLSFGENTIDSTIATVTVGGGGSVGFGPVEVGTSRGRSLGTNYDISVGPNTAFSGGIEPIRNQRDTPEDEFALNAYSFKPVVYRQRYKNAQQKESAFYVMVYSVDR